MKFTTLSFLVVCLLVDLVLGFCYSYITLETGGFELASTIILVLEVNRLTMCVAMLSEISKNLGKISVTDILLTEKRTTKKYPYLSICLSVYLSFYLSI